MIDQKPITQINEAHETYIEVQLNAADKLCAIWHHQLIEYPHEYAVPDLLAGVI